MTDANRMNVLLVALLKVKIDEGELEFTEIEQKLDLGKGYVNQLVNNPDRLKLNHLFGILDILGVPPAEFFATMKRLSQPPRMIEPGAPQPVATLWELHQALDPQEVN